MLLAPLFVFIKDGYGVTYTELSLALAAFGVVSAVLQTPVGFFVDRFGARLNLIGGLLLGSAAVAAAGLVDSFWVFIAMFAVMGLANTVYHPADYALLSERVTPQRIPQVFSFHTCSGMIGSAVAPAPFCSCRAWWGGAAPLSVLQRSGSLRRLFSRCRVSRRRAIAPRRYRSRAATIRRARPRTASASCCRHRSC